MHFSRLLLERYKVFQLPCEIEIRPLTILVGANNAGRSALARAMPLLAGGLQRREPSAKAVPLPLASFGLTHADSFEELIAGRSAHRSVRIEADFRADRQETSLAVTIQNVVSSGQVTRQVVSRWTLTLTGGRRVEIERPHLDSDTHRITITIRGMEVELRGEVVWAGLIPQSDELQLEAPEHRWLKEALTALSEWSRGVTYLGSPRELLESPFPTLPSPAGGVGVSGREAPRLLAIWANIQKDVVAWYRDTFNVSLHVRQEGETSSIEVLGEPGSVPISIAQAGLGLSQVLPVAVQCVAARRAGPGVDIIELPETGLHPRAHAAVADLIVESLTGPARPMVVETHSEVLLLRIRRHVAQGNLAAGDVVVYWIDRDEETGGASARKVEISASGDVINWPEGVFQEDYEEVVAIRREARSRGAK